jgi:hypothetical protein
MLARLRRQLHVDDRRQRHPASERRRAQPGLEQPRQLGFRHRLRPGHLGNRADRRERPVDGRLPSILPRERSKLNGHSALALDAPALSGAAHQQHCREGDDC